MAKEATYTVLARKWRPRQFDDVVGQTHVTDTLKNAIQSNRIAHAYLFVGPRGIGKTSIARILAKALNCEKGPTITPCDKCDSCREVADGRSMDVLEIDGASNNKVDNVRDLRETVKYLPARDRFKIYVIDEVHMLSDSAFNALLKTLEEPPPHVKFIFATTEPQKILPTIVSRCQRFDLSRIPVALIVQRLSDIAKAEKVDVDPKALTAVARGAEGGLRDAESALDQLISFTGGKIVEEDVLSVFGLISSQTLVEMVDAILKGDVPVLMTRVAAIDHAGKDLQRLGIDLLSYFRNLLVSTYSSDAIEGVDVLADEAEILKRQARMTSPERLLKIADILIEADGRLRYALSKRTLLEVALIRCARMATSVTIDEIVAQINKLKNSLGAPQTAGARPAAGSAPIMNAVSGTSARASEEVPPQVREAVVCKEEMQDSGAKPGSGASGVTDEIALLRGQWRLIVEKVGKVAPMAKSAILDACPMSVEGNIVVVGFDPEFAEHMKRMDMPRHSQALQSELTAILRRDVRIKCRLLKTGEMVKLPSDTPAEVEAAAKNDSTVASNHADVPKAPEGRKTVAEWMRDDAVRKTIDMFDGQIVDVRE